MLYRLARAKDLVLKPDTKEWLVLRVPYPQGFHSRGMDGRIDDPNAGWKGRGVYATYGADAHVIEVGLTGLVHAVGSESCHSAAQFDETATGQPVSIGFAGSAVICRSAQW